MKRQAKIIILSALLLLIPTLCFAISPIKIAILPPIDSAGYKSSDINNLVTFKMMDNFKYPYYEIVPAKEILATTNWNPATKHLPDKASLQRLASATAADAIIVMQYETMYSAIWFHPFAEESTETNNVVLRCLIYQTKEDELISIKAARSESAEPSVNRLQTLTAECMDEIIQKVSNHLPRIPKQT